MRNKGKITTQRSRDYGRTDLGKAKVKEAAKVVFCQDLDVSSRILAVLGKSVSKNKVNVHIREPYTKEFVVKTKNGKEYKKTKTKYKVTVVESFNEIERYSVICGSNGKTGVRYNTVVAGKDKINPSSADIKKRLIVGRQLSDKEFVELFNKQHTIFKNIFTEEYQSALQRIG